MKKFVYAFAVCLAACLSTGCSDNDDPDPVPEGEKVTLTTAGTLGKVLGDRLTTVETLTVTGPINEFDLETARIANITGKLKKLDMSGTTTPEGVFPAWTFFPPGINSVLSTDEALLYDNVEFSLLILSDDTRRIDGMTFCHTKIDVFVLPATLKEIGMDAFAGGDCTFSSIYIKAQEPPVCLSDYTFDYADERTLYVPVGCKAKYAAADQWKDFGKIIETKDFPTVR